MSIRIITDSGSDCMNGEHPQLTVLPLSIAFGDTVYRSDVDITRERFYEMLVEGDVFPTTGQVNPYAFERAIEQAWGNGEDVVVITLSSKLSGTHQSALSAAASAKGAGAVHVVDSLNATLGQRILVQQALRLVDSGASTAQIASAIEGLASRVTVVGLLDTLEYLKRGGRVSAAAAGVGELLSIKPVITVCDGSVEVLGKARGSKNGRNLLHKEVERAGGIDFSLPASVGYTGMSDKLLQKYLADNRSVWEEGATPEMLRPVLIGPTIGTHAGPGAIAVAFFNRLS